MKTIWKVFKIIWAIISSLITVLFSIGIVGVAMAGELDNFDEFTKDMTNRVINKLPI